MAPTVKDLRHTFFGFGFGFGFAFGFCFGFWIWNWLWILVIVLVLELDLIWFQLDFDFFSSFDSPFSHSRQVTIRRNVASLLSAHESVIVPRGIHEAQVPRRLVFHS
jgi:hypothetical protein